MRPPKSAAALAVLAAASLAVPLGGTAAASASSSRRGGPPACRTSRLVIWVAGGSGTAGSSYHDLEFANHSGHACTLSGYPGVSGVGLVGGRLGSAASRMGGGAHRVTIGARQVATATLRVVDVGAFPSSRCDRRYAAGLRVYPPNRSVSKVVPFSFEACGRSGPRYLEVGAVH